MDVTGAALKNAPAQFTPFVGREREIALIRSALESTRLLTLTGAGGSGKTRLALEVAGREAATRGQPGVWVELAALSEPALVGDTVLAALGLRDESGAPPAELIARELAGRPLLLVLDNAEHLLHACATFVDALLRASDQVRILVTSRAALGVNGETAWLVPPLSMTSVAGSADEPEAVQLFVQRGQAAAPSFRLTAANRPAVHQVCARLDGLPLALELAAARLRALTPEQIAQRLDDRFRLLTTGNRAALPRQQTLRATIDWSHELLERRERVLLARLSVFRGSFTLEAVEAVTAGDPIATEEVLDLLAALVDRSMVEVIDATGQSRYRLLETIREYAAERLAELGETDTRMRRHAAYYGALIREVEPLLRTRSRPAAMERLTPELENLRTAMSCSRHCDVQIHLRIVGLLHWFWFSSGQWPEAQQWLAGALALPEAQAPTLDRAYLLFSAGAIAALQGRCDDARRHLEEAEQIAEREGDPLLLTNVRNYLGMALNQAGDASALEVILRARPWMEQTNDLYALRLNFLLHGQALVQRGDLEGAIAVTEEGVRVARVFGLSRELGIALQQLASIVARTGDWRRTRSLLAEAFGAMRADPMLLFISRGLELMGSSAAAESAWEDTARLHGAAEAIRAQIGAEMWGVDKAHYAPHLQKAVAALGASRFERIVAEGRALEIPEAIDLALAVGERLGNDDAPDRSSDTGTWRIPEAAVPPAATERLAVRTLGGLEIVAAGAPMSRKTWSSSKARELLLFLLWHPEGSTREEIGVALWPDASSAQLRNSFHVALHHLRRALGHPDWIRFERERYVLAVPGGAELDAMTFEQAAGRALRATRRGEAPLDELAAALAVYRGEYLAGESPGDWQYEIRDRLASLHADLLDAQGAALQKAGRLPEAIAAFEALVEREPLREGASRRLMSALAESGDREGASRVLARLEAAYRREGLGSPGRETVDLARRLHVR